MALILSLPTEYPLETLETYILRNFDADARWPSQATFHGETEIYRDRRFHIQVYRGQLSLSGDKSLDVICKIGFGKTAKGRVAHEASLYNGKLGHLQGVHIPLCHGYFVGDTDEGQAGCLLVAYCGEPIKEMLMPLPPKFKTALVNSLVAIHDAGVEHRNLGHRNILDCDGLPMITNFDNALDHECGRHIPIEEGIPGPSLISEIGCTELYQFFIDLRIWTPGYIRYIGSFQPIKLAFDAHALARTAPSNWSPEEALKEAYRVITAHVKKHYPEQYYEWKAGLEKKRETEPNSTSTSPCDGTGAESCSWLITGPMYASLSRCNITIAV